MDKPTQMTQQQFAVILIETLTCCGLQATKSEMAVWYNRFHWVRPEVFKKACDWYERQPGQKFINGFYSTIRPVLLDYSRDYSGVLKGWEPRKAISPEKVRRHQIEQAKAMKRNHLEGPTTVGEKKRVRQQVKKTVAEYARNMIQGTEPPATDKQEAARQIADLNKMIKRKKHDEKISHDS